MTSAEDTDRWCVECNGEGVTDRERCEACRGTGLHVKRMLATIDALEAALDWYANDDIYRGHDPAVLFDVGVRARSALGDLLPTCPTQSGSTQP